MRPRRVFLVGKKPTSHISEDNFFRSHKENVNLQLQPKAMEDLRNEPEKSKYPTIDIKETFHSRKYTYGEIINPHSKGILCETRNNSEFVPRNETERMADIEIQNLNTLTEYGDEINSYERSIEVYYLPRECLRNHEITPGLRAKMVDWMVEVLTSFKCKDQTFFMAISLMDRYLSLKTERRLISDLHSIGVTSIFLASKYEDILPLRMSTVVDKIAHHKVPSELITNIERDILMLLDYYLQVPTVLEYLTRYLVEMEVVLGLEKEWIGKMSI